MTSQPRRRAATAVAVALLAVLGWLVAGPRGLGGSATYVVTHGSSMQPRFRTGDLAVVRPAGRYAVGDVVAYPSRTTGTTVLHRIIGTEGDAFVLKGDSNAWVDPDPVPAGSIAGKLALRVPRGGLLLGVVRGPRGAVFVGLVVVLVTTAGAVRSPRRHKEESVSTNSRLAGAAAATALLAGAACLTYARPATEPGLRDTGLRHETSLDYEAVVPASPVYEDGRIGTGDTVFRSVAPEIGVRVGYRLSGEASGLGGTLTTEAVVSDDSGWSHSVPLGEPVRFSGPSASATRQLRFADLDRLVADVGRRTGVPADRYTVALAARISVDGVAGGKPLTTSVAAPSLDLAVERGTARPSAAVTSRPAVSVTPVSVPGDVPATVLLGGRRVPVTSARTAAAAGAGLAAIVTAGLWLAGSRRRRGAEPERLAARYPGRIVEVEVVNVPPDRNVVELADVAALVALADRFDRPVLHEVRGGMHTYVVENDRSLYRYRGASVPEQRPAPELVDAARASAR